MSAKVFIRTRWVIISASPTTYSASARSLSASKAGAMSSPRRITHFQRRGGISDIGYDCQPAQIGHDFAQQRESLAGNIGRLHGQTGDVTARSREACNQPHTNRVVH